MSFPFETLETELSIQESSIPREYEINFNTGQLTGKIVDKKEAVKVWVYLALHTARYRYLIYSWDYGNELEELIGKSYSKEYLDTECRRMVEDCLMVNKYITGIRNFNTSLIEDRMTLSFFVDTLFGEVEINV